MKAILTVSTTITLLLLPVGLSSDQSDLSDCGQSETEVLPAGTVRPFEISPGVTMDFCWVPPDSFMMGLPDTAEGRPERSNPEHMVTIGVGFWFGKFEVTQAQWTAVMGSNPSKFTDNDQRPVEMVSWSDAQEFLRKLNRHAGSAAYRLPSEAEWEYACRAGTRTQFFTGSCISDDEANFNARFPLEICEREEYRKETTPVGSFAPNPWGFHDMHGNVWEWCADVWHDNYEGAPTDGSAWTSGGDQAKQVMRGGGWSSHGRHLRSGYRNSYDVLRRAAAFGLRVVKD